MTLQRLERQLVLVALAEQHAERTLAVAALARRRGETAAEQCERAATLVAGELGVRIGWVGRIGGRAALGFVLERRLGERLLDQLAFDPARGQPAPDAVRAPLLERALVLHEQTREPLVVEDPLLEQLVDRGVDGVLLELAREQVRANLGDRPIAAVELPVREPERPLDLIDGVLGYAARPSTDSTASSAPRSASGFARG
jgi:hypothetical protein